MSTSRTALRRVVAALAMGAAGLTMQGCGDSPDAPAATPRTPTVAASGAATGVPMSFSAPTIKVSGELTETRAKNGVVNPPPGTLGWVSGYERVRPGEVGTAVIAGHVVDGRKPDVFANLEQISKGDAITVVDASGTVVTYSVTATRVATKEEVSHDPDVWGANTTVRRIALITCDDEDGYREDGHRVSNFVAIAEAR